MNSFPLLIKNKEDYGERGRKDKKNQARGFRVLRTRQNAILDYGAVIDR
jgi:hypothetical protein